MTNPATEWDFQTQDATAIDEVGILGQAGREGWELIDFGPFKLHFRRPKDQDRITPWEYERRSGILGDRIRQEMREAGWEPAGQWFVFHYFKRRQARTR